MEPPAKSSFLQRQISKEDAIIQLFRPNLGNRIGQALDLFDRIVSEAEILTTLGTELQVGKDRFLITPKDLQNNLDEFGELQSLATKGRVLLNDLGYVPRIRATPITGPGTAPVGQNVDVQAIATTLPGREPLSGVVITPKKK